jgi:hypothetical protein
VRPPLALLLVAACGASLPVPTDLSRIDVRGGDLRKEGVAVGGAACGDRYMEAVTGVPAAEAEITACHGAVLAAGGGMIAFVGLASVLAATGEHTSTGPFGFELGTAVAVFVGSCMAVWFAKRHRDRAIEIYNAAVERRAAMGVP